MNRDSLHNDSLRSHGLLSQVLRSLPARIPPPDLTTRLRVVASRESARRRQTLGERWLQWTALVRREADNIMRPFALPVAGGLFSAVTLFSMCVVPNYPLRAQTKFDVPTMLTTEPAIRGTIAMEMESSGETVVDVTIDDQGRMVDYKVVAGGVAILTDATLRRRLENRLLFTEFIPGTSFGKPMTTSVVRVSMMGLSQLDVKG